MAGQKRLRKIKIQFVNAVEDPKNRGRYIITLRFDDGKAEGPWQQSWFVPKPETKVNPEEFIEKLKERPEEIHRPIEFFEDVKKSAEQKETFEIVI